MTENEFVQGQLAVAHTVVYNLKSAIRRFVPWHSK